MVPSALTLQRGEINHAQRQITLKNLRKSIVRILPLVPILAAYVVLRSLFWRCPPIWDGQVYYTSLLAAVEFPFDLLNYSTDNHVCQGFFFVASLPVWIFGQNYFAFNVWLTVFAVASTIVFYKIADHLTDGKLPALELALVTCLFAFHPSVLASMIHFNPDIGVMTFFLCQWLMLLQSKTTVATVFALLLIFSKEVSMLLLPLPFVFCFFYQTAPTRWRWVRNNAVCLVVPYLMLGAFLIYKTVIRGQPAFWVEHQKIPFWQTFINMLQADANLLNFLMMAFVMSFTWILALIGLLLLLLVLLFLKPHSPKNGSGRRTAILLYYFLYFCTLCIFAVRPYANVRYVILILPILLLCILYWALFLGVPRLVRVPSMVILLALFLFANFKTTDPFSIAYFGTFNFGTHKLLAVAKRTNDSGGVGRDELVYNLEFLKIPKLIEKTMQDLRPLQEDFILAHSALNWATFTRLDAMTYRATFQDDQSFSPHVTTASRVVDLPETPASVYYFAFPNCDNSKGILRLSAHYPGRKSRRYEIDGYQMDVLYFYK